jgi:H+/Cl- antiporter ClcA
VLPAGADARTSGVGGDTISAAFASALPRIAQRSCDEPGAVGAAAAAAGLGGLIALPVVDDGAVVETVVLYF